MLKKIFLFTLAIIGILITGVVLFIIIKNEPLPEGNKQPKDAMQLALRMSMAINKPSWDSTAYVRWTFQPREHHYIWDKKNHLVEVQWDNKRVLIAPNQRKYIVFENENKINPNTQAKQFHKLSQKALAHFNNDSFWLNAPAKINDAGTKRDVVTLADGRKGLMVTYTQGGTTPGDTYVWILDENYRPTSWKMWVSIIPIGGMEFSWENWEQTSTGAWIARKHKHPLYDIPITKVKTGNTLVDIEAQPKIFEALKNELSE